MESPPCPTNELTGGKEVVEARAAARELINVRSGVGRCQRAPTGGVRGRAVRAETPQVELIG